MQKKIDGGELSREEISRRLETLFYCRNVVIAKESNLTFGLDYQVALRTINASKNTAPSLIRNAFPEFKDHMCYVKSYKGWGTLLAYTTKKERTPFVTGELPLGDILFIADKAREKRVVSEPTSYGLWVIYVRLAVKKRVCWSETPVRLE